MKRTLKQLIRLGRQQLDEKRREQAALFAQIDQLMADEAGLQQGLAREQAAASADPVAGMAFAAYAQSVRDRRARLDQRRAELDRQAADKAEEIRDAFEDVKRYEIMLERKEADAKAERDRLEQANLDEIGLNRHTSAAPGAAN